MKRYWLFSGDDNYPGGGMRDFVGAFDSLEGARTAPHAGDWAHVFDAQDGVIVAWRNEGQPWLVERRRLELWRGL